MLIPLSLPSDDFLHEPPSDADLTEPSTTNLNKPSVEFPIKPKAPKYPTQTNQHRSEQKQHNPTTPKTQPKPPTPYTTHNHIKQKTQINQSQGTIKHSAPNRAAYEITSFREQMLVTTPKAAIAALFFTTSDKPFFYNIHYSVTGIDG